MNPEEPLPIWAARKSNGNYLEVNAQLCTRDGRKIGNARVAVLKTPSSAVIKTDMGAEMTLTINELRELYYPPEYIINY